MLARVSIVACDNGGKMVSRRTDAARDTRKESNVIQHEVSEWINM